MAPRKGGKVTTLPSGTTPTATYTAVASIDV